MYYICYVCVTPLEEIIIKIKNWQTIALKTGFKRARLYIRLHVYTNNKLVVGYMHHNHAHIDKQTQNERHSFGVVFYDAVDNYDDDDDDVISREIILKEIFIAEYWKCVFRYIYMYMGWSMVGASYAWMHYISTYWYFVRFGFLQFKIFVLFIWKVSDWSRTTYFHRLNCYLLDDCFFFLFFFFLLFGFPLRISSTVPHAYFIYSRNRNET